MPNPETHEQLNKIFERHYHDSHEKLRSDNTRFIHYTSAENAFKIISGRELWLRSPMTMNDRSEFTYGIECLKSAFNSDVGCQILNIFNELSKEKQSFSQRTNKFLDNISTHIQFSYSLCFTEFDGDCEGLLSMWRAYGGKNPVGLVFKREHFFHSGIQQISVFPVTYYTELQITSVLNDFLLNIKANLNLLQGLDEFFLNYYFNNKIYNLATHNKHPAFKEEKEWRITFKAKNQKIDNLSPQVINGVPQLVKKYLLHEELNGSSRHDISDLLEKIIIGPCDFPINIAQAFLTILHEMKDPDAAAKIHLTNIPLRI